MCMNYPTAAQLRRLSIRFSVASADNSCNLLPTRTMISIKSIYSIILFAAATAMSDSDEWRYFGALLLGAALSALAGLSMLLLNGKPVPRQIIHARLLANGVFGLGLGVAVLYTAIQREWHTGPILTTAIGFFSGLFGVAIVKIVEPTILKKIQDKMGNTDSTIYNPPSDHGPHK